MANFYNNTSFNQNNGFNTNNNYNNLELYKNKSNINYIKSNNIKYINNNIGNENKANNISNENNEKKKIFNKLNINIKLGEKISEKEIMIDLENSNKEEIVNNILKEYNLDQSYFEPLLNLIDNTIDLLNNFNKIRTCRYQLKNIGENKGYNFSYNKNHKKIDDNNLNDSFIFELIENNLYKKYIDNIKPDYIDIVKNQNRNFSFDYKRK